MKVQDICKKQRRTHKKVLNRCRERRFILDGIVYEVEDISTPCSCNA